MRTVIAFASKSGTTKRCATFLRTKIPFADIADLSRQNVNVEDYDLIIIGASVRMGMIHKDAKSFIEKNAGALKQKKTAFFICCGFPENAPEIFKKNIPSDLLPNAICAMPFGGELDMNVIKGAEKMIVKMMVKVNKNKGIPLPKILHENIDEFALKINECG
jgi:menaquinone-dependent protoporphyrinogen oxidase